MIFINIWFSCWISAWAGEVGAPVDGPPRMTLTIRQGISAIQASPRFSCFREKPGPLVAVMAFAPVKAAPITEPMALISSSIWMNLPPLRGSRAERNSAISEDGDMGYPPKKVHPAAIAPSAHASLPWTKRISLLMSTSLVYLFLINLPANSLSTMMAKSGQCRSHNWHPMHLSG